MPDWTNPCAACPRKYGLRAIGGDGPRPSSVLGILERPGQDENRQGRIACGKTGQELDDLYLPLAGLSRHDIRLCNTVLCGHESNKAPTDKEIAQCAPSHIPDEIERTQPAVILLMGSSACSLVPGIRLDMHHGIPQHTRKVGELFGWRGWLIPMFHPAIGLHESRFMQVCMDDWAGLKDYMQEGFTEDPAPEPVAYHEWSEQLITWLSSPGYPVSVDTESHGGKPWSLQVSGRSNTGVLFRTNDRQAMECASFRLSLVPEIVMHHAAYDLEVLRSLGIHVRSYRDTMQEAFHLGNLPQGLKALSYRLFRYTMTSYNETVRPASVRALLEWLTEALCIAQADLSFVTKRFHKTSGKPLSDKVEGSAFESLLIRLLRLTDPDGEYDPWGTEKEPRLDAFWRDELNSWMVTHVEARIGKYPVSGIANCTMAEAVRYAVGDADYTGRAAVELARRRNGAFKIYEGDRDA